MKNLHISNNFYFMDKLYLSLIFPIRSLYGGGLWYFQYRFLLIYIAGIVQAQKIGSATGIA